MTALNPKDVIVMRMTKFCRPIHLTPKFNNIKLVHFHRLYVDQHYLENKNIKQNNKTSRFVALITVQVLKKI